MLFKPLEPQEPYHHTGRQSCNAIIMTAILSPLNPVLDLCYNELSTVAILNPLSSRFKILR